jgi:hypothetical protein
MSEREQAVEAAKRIKQGHFDHHDALNVADFILSPRPPVGEWSREFVRKVINAHVKHSLSFAGKTASITEHDEKYAAMESALTAELTALFASRGTGEEHELERDAIMFAAMEPTERRDCMGCGMCHDCIISTMEASHAAELAEEVKHREEAVKVAAEINRDLLAEMKKTNRLEYELARHVLDAGVKSDDGEAVTEEWLLAEGWEPKSHRGNQDRWEKTLKVQRHDDSAGATRHWLVVHRSDDGEWWPIDLRQQFIADDGENHKEDAVALLSWLDLMTRGHIRQLIAALSIPLD